MRDLRLFCGAAILAAGPAAYAQDAAAKAAPPAGDADLREYVKKLEQRVDELEKTRPGNSLQDDVSSKAKPATALEDAIQAIKVSGHMEFGYSYNFRQGDAVAGRRGATLGFNQLRGPDSDVNGLSFQELELLVDRPLTTVGSTGFHVSADWGVVARQADADPNFDGGPNANAFDVREAFFSWRAPFEPTNHVDLAVGKFRTPIGFETFGGYALNWLVTRNPINVYGTPTTHTGLRATAPLNSDETLATSIYLVNGWEEVREANGGKNVVWNMAFGKYDWLSSTVNVNVAYGAIEGAGAHQGDKRWLGNLIWTGNFSENLEFALDAVSGRQPSRSWSGAAAYLRQKLGDKTTLAGRFGWYHDDALGTHGARIEDASISIGYAVTKDVTIALEYRHDISRSDGTFLSASGGPARSQDTLTAAFVYQF